MIEKSNNGTIDFFEKQISSFIEQIRPPEEVRDKLDLGYKYANRTFEIFEIRPRLDDKNRKSEFSMAKGRFVISKGVWKLYWKRASGKWEPYQANPKVRDLSEVFEIITEDQYGCFWG